MSQYTQEDAKIGGKAAMPDGSLRPSFLLKGRVLLIAVDRLVAAGVCPEFAVNVAIWFHRQGNMDGLEAYVQEIEARHATGAQLHPAFVSHR